MRAGMRVAIWVGTLLLPLTGCTAGQKMATLPDDGPLIRDQLIIQSDASLPHDHPLVDELIALRGDVVERLGLPVSSEPIHVFLFDTPERFGAFMAQHYPEFPERRAFFVERDMRRAIYTFWGERIAEDLRHEVTHGYVHSMVPQLPLWLDEGLAEFFEVPCDEQGLNRPHLALLQNSMRQQRWAPSMVTLENVRFAGELTQQHYAEAWAWVHFLLETTPQRRTLLRGHLARLRMTATAPPLSESLAAAEPLAARALVEHLMSLDDTARPYER